MSGIKDMTVLRAVLRAVVGDQPLRNSRLVEDSFETIDDSARADVSQCSYDRKLAVEVGKLSGYSVPFQWNRSAARVCQSRFGTSCGISVSFVLAT